MYLIALRNWFSRVNASARRKSRGRYSPRVRSRPCLETLEGRTLPSAVLVKDINVAPAGHDPEQASSNPASLTNVGGKLYFVADDGVNGPRLWQSDGTTQGTIALAGATAASHPDSLIDVADSLYFMADGTGSGTRKLWKSDGTSAGTARVQFPAGTSLTVHTPSSFTAVGNKLFFVETINGSSGPTFNLWDTDGTTAGTGVVQSFSGFPGPFTAVGNALFFAAPDGTNGNALWISDSSGTRVVKDLSSLSGLTSFRGQLFFAASDSLNDVEPWVSDGTAAGTHLLKDLNQQATTANPASSSSPQQLTAVDDHTLYFTASDGLQPSEVWKTDGTPDGTMVVASLPKEDPFPRNFTEANGTVFFTATDFVTNVQLWKTDGTPGGSKMLTQLPFQYTNSVAVVGVGPTVFFTVLSIFPVAGVNELWSSDGTVAGTTFEQINNTTTGGHANAAAPREMTNVNGTLFFSADDGMHGRELWARTVTTPSQLQFDTSSYTVDESTGRITLTVTRRNSTDTAVSVHFTTSDGTAVAGTDYTASSGTLAFDAGQISKPLTINILDDSQVQRQETFNITLSAPTGASLGATAMAVVTIIDDDGPRPNANDDVANVNPNSHDIPIDVLAHDSNAPGVSGPLTITAVTQGTKGGHVQITNNGAMVTYSPPSPFTGLDLFTYTITDSTGATATATVTVLVLSGVSPPIANPDTFTVTANSFQNRLDVLRHDHLGSGSSGTLTITAVTQPAHGRVEISQDKIIVIYTPFGNVANVTDQFTYTISDGQGGTASTFVNVTILPNDGSISGQVYNDLNHNGAHDPGERGLNGWTVELIDRLGNVVASQLTHTGNLNGQPEEGLYRFAHLEPDQFTVRARTPQGWIQTQPRDFQLPLGEFINGFGLSPDQIDVGASPTAVAVADFTGRGLAGFAVTRTSDGHVLVSPTNELGVSTRDYDVSPNMPGSGRPSALAAVDVNGDNKPDLIVTDEANNTVAIFLNRGDGTFDAPVLRRTGRSPKGLVAFLDGYDLPDVAVTNQDDNTVTVFQNLGGGHFDDGTTFPAGPSPFGITAVDRQHNGRPDLVVTNLNSNTLTILHNDGTGDFSQSDIITVGQNPWAVTAADLNHRGFAGDLAVTNRGDNSVTILLNRGNGTFQPPIAVPVGNTPEGVVAADLDGTGYYNDLAVANTGSDNITVLHNFGNGAFTTTTHSAQGHMPVALAAGNLSGQDKPDLAVLNQDSGQVAVLLSNVTLSYPAVSVHLDEHVTGEDFGNYQAASPPPASPGIEVSNSPFIDNLYHVLLERTANGSERAFWKHQQDTGASQEQVANGFLNSPEYRKLQIDHLYQQLLHRAPDAAGENASLKFLGGGGTLDQVEEAILGSPEYFQAHGGTIMGFLKAVYHDELNGRLPDGSGVATWSKALAQGISRTDVARAIRHSAEGIGDQVNRFYGVYLDRLPDLPGSQAWMQKWIQGGGVQPVEVGILTSMEFNKRRFVSPHVRNQIFLERVYRILLGRTLDDGGRMGWMSLLDAGVARAQVVLDIESDPGSEFYKKVVKDLYVYLLGRPASNPATDDEVNAQVAVLRAGGTFDDVRANLMATGEFSPLPVSGQTNSSNHAFITRLLAAILGRTGDFSGDPFHPSTLTDDQRLESALNDGRITRREAAMAALAGVPIPLHTDATGSLAGAPAQARGILEYGNNFTGFTQTGYFLQLLGTGSVGSYADWFRVVDFPHGGTSTLRTIIAEFEGNRPIDPANPNGGNYPPLREEHFIADLLGTT